MTIERLTHFANPANHRLTQDQCDHIAQTAGDLTRHGETLDEEVVGEMFGQDIVELCDEIGLQAIQDEVFVRAVLSGQAESEFWSGDC